jgi:hypothetical protein
MSYRFNFSEAEVAAYCAARLRDGHRQGDEHRGPCSIHGSDHRNDSFSVNLRNGLWQCHACGQKGNLIQLEQKISNCNFTEALANISEIIGRDLIPKWPFPFAPPEGLTPWSTQYLAEEILKMEGRLHAKAVDLYAYRGNAAAHDGLPARAQVPMPKIRLTIEKNGKTQKTFRWRALTQKGGWRTPDKEHAIPDLYRQHEWHDRGVTKLHLLNGEKAVNRAHKEWGLIATCLPNGEKPGKPAPQEYIDTLARTPCLYLVVDNDDVGRRHAGSLGARLLQAGATEVRLVELPGLPPKGDLYDFIDAGGTQEQYLEAAYAAPLADANYQDEDQEKRQKTRPRAASAAASGSNGHCDTGNETGGKNSENDDDGPPRAAGSGLAPDEIANTHPYKFQNGGIVRVKETKQGIEEIRLTNFAPIITDDIAEDDGVETKRHLRLQATISGRRASFTVPASKFHQMDWPIEQLGPEAIVYPNQEKYARTGIQTLSGKIPTTRVYTHTGWRKVGDLWLYLHGAGAIGANGLVEGINVQLSGALSHFELELPANKDEMRVAINASLHVLDNAPDCVTFPIGAATYRAAIKSADFAVWLAGPTGVFKSEEAALAQQHYGAVMDARHLPASFASTGNALETIAFYAKDAFLVIDDFAPHGSQQDIARYHGVAERLVRAVGNSQGRGRLTADARLRAEKAPRGLILVTGEDMPRGQSIRGRILLVEIGPGDVNTSVLTENQSDAAQGLYAKSIAGFIRYLAANYEPHQAEFRAAVLKKREDATKVHSRTPGIVADLYCAFDCFLTFAHEAGAITESRRHELADRCWNALSHVARAQRAPQDASEPAHHYIRLLSAALAAGRAHVAGPDGQPPNDNEAWGWRTEVVGENTRIVAKGICIGWVEGINLYLEPTAAYAAAQDFARSTGEPLTISEISLNKRLQEKGLLTTVDRTRKTLTVRRTLQGVKRKVLHMRSAVLLDDVSFQDQNVSPLSGFSNETDNDFANKNNNLQQNVGFVSQNPGEESPAENAEGDDAAAAEEDEFEL